MPISRVVAVSLVVLTVVGCRVVGEQDATAEPSTSAAPTSQRGSPTPSAPVATATPVAPAPTPTGEPRATFSPVGDLQLDNLTWQIVTDPFEGSPNNYVKGLYRNGRDLVAWGVYEDHTETTSETGAAFWSTADGATWAEGRLGEPGRWTDVRDVSSGPGGFVAVGEIDGVATAWHSADGIDWTTTPISPLPSVESEYLVAVAAGPEGYLAVGSMGGDNDSRPAGWFSPTGTSWTRFVVEMPASWFQDVATGPNGEFVAVGVDYSSNGAHEALWRFDSDRSEWTRATSLRDSDGPGNDDIYYVVALPEGYVAFGMHARPGGEISCKGCYWDPDLWRAYISDDGLAWSRRKVSGTGPVTPSLPWDGAVEPWAEGLLAIGQDADNDNRLWLSADGVGWEAIGDPIGTGDEASYSYFDTLVFDKSIVVGGMTLSGGVVAIGTTPAD